MNLNRIILTTAGILSLGAAMQAASTATRAQDESSKSPGKVRVVTKAQSKPQDSDSVTRSHSIAVTTADGQTTVVLDGKKIPQGQIKVDDNAVIILDQDGNVLKSIDIQLDWADMHLDKWREIATVIGDDWTVGGHFDFDGNENFEFEFLNPDDLRFGDATLSEPPSVMLGVFLDEPGEALRKHLQLGEEGTAMIAEVLEGLPAAVAGLERYDIIIEIDGTTPADPAAIHKVLSTKQPGDTVTLRVIQSGRKGTVDITLSEYDAEKMMQFRSPNRIEKRSGGNAWFVTPPDFNFEGTHGDIIIPDNLHRDIQVFVRPYGIDEVMEIPDFQIDLEAGAMRDALREALKHADHGVRQQREVLEQLRDASEAQEMRLREMPRLRVRGLHEADAGVLRELEKRLQGVRGFEFHHADEALDRAEYDNILKRLPRLEIERSIKDAEKSHERALQVMPEIRRHLDEARTLHDTIRGAAPSVNSEIEAVKKRLDRLEELLNRLMQDIEGEGTI